MKPSIVSIISHVFYMTTQIALPQIKNYNHSATGSSNIIYSSR